MSHLADWTQVGRLSLSPALLSRFTIRELRFPRGRDTTVQNSVSFAVEISAIGQPFTRVPRSRVHRHALVSILRLARGTESTRRIAGQATLHLDQSTLNVTLLHCRHTYTEDTRA
jgi:hypothetical protein